MRERRQNVRRSTSTAIASRCTNLVVKLPNADRTIVDAAKVRDYLLSPSHPVGRFKAVVFATLGLSSTNWEELSVWLLESARSAEAVPGQPSPYGQKYEVRATFSGRNGRMLEVVSVWIILAGDDVPRLITAFPG